MGFLDKMKGGWKAGEPTSQTGNPARTQAPPVTPAEGAKPSPSGAKPAAPAEEAKGAYLTFDGASNGTLFIVWSATPVDGAMAFFEPQKPVPEFKYKDKGGKSEIVRNMMEDKAKYYEGWCQFFKVACEHHGVCKLLPGAELAPLKVDVVFLDGSKVHHLESGTTLRAKPMTAIACIPRGDRGLHAQTLQKDVFLRNARRGGAAITL